MERPSDLQLRGSGLDTAQLSIAGQACCWHSLLTGIKKPANGGFFES
jgi:hypothetical protein